MSRRFVFTVQKAEKMVNSKRLITRQVGHTALNLHDVKIGSGSEEEIDEAKELLLLSCRIMDQENRIHSKSIMFGFIFGVTITFIALLIAMWML